MSQAEALLNSLDSAVVASETIEVDNGHIVIDEQRFITVPESLKRLGVEHDHNIETVTFDCPRYWDGHDMSQMKIYVNYLCPDGTKGRCLTTNLVVGYDMLNFDWVISNNVTRTKGTLSFLVCIVKTDSEGIEERHWNSELNQECYISEGMECQEAMIVGYPDIITHLLIRMDEVEAIATPEAMQNYTAEWLEANHDTLLAEIETKAKEALDSIPEDYATVAALADEGARTKADAICLSAEGETIVLEDSSDDPLQGLTLFGKTTQVTTTGAQLFTPYAEQTTTFGSATIANNGATITVIGTYYAAWPIVLKAGMTYYIDFTASGSTANRGVRFKYTDETLSDTIANPSVFTPTQDTTDIYLYSGSGTSATVIYHDFRIVEGSATLPWEPYSGGVASPSPEWPQELTSLGSSGGITTWVHGKNLADLNKAKVTDCEVVDVSTGAVRLDITDQYYARVYLNYLSEYMLSNQGKTFTFSVDNNPVGRISIVIEGNRNSAVNGSLTYQEVNSDIGDTSISITPIDFSEITAVSLRIGRLGVAHTDTTSVFSGISFSLDDDISFEHADELQSLTVSRTLPGIPVSSGGNYTDSNGQQWICDEIDFERGIYIQRISVDYHVSAVSNVNMNNTERDWVSAYLVLGDQKPSAPMFCTISPVEAWESMNQNASLGCGALFWYAPASCGIAIRRDVLDLTTDPLAENSAVLSVINDWLLRNNVFILYALATPIETSLTAAEIAAYEALRTNRTSTTIVNSDRAWMRLKYNADTKIYLDNLPKATDNQIQTAVDAWLTAYFTTAEEVSF